MTFGPISTVFTGKRLWATLFSLFFVVVFIGLGVWQLDRAAYKASVQETLTENRELPLVEIGNVNIGSVQNDPAQWRFRQVTLTGFYEPGYTVFLDNRVNRGIAGYHVLTPFRLDGDLRIIVNRGWIAAGARQALPEVMTETERQQITVSLDLIADSSFTLGDVVDNDTWPQRWTHLNQGVVADSLPFKVLPMVGILTGGDRGSKFEQIEIRFADTWVARHKGYALQWFLMALVLAVLYARLMWRTPST